MALQPRIHRGKIIGTERRQGMTVLPPLGQARNPTPEETTARVERHKTPPLRQSQSRAEALAQLVARLTDAARHRIVSTQTWVKGASPHFDMLAPRLQICVLGDWLQDVVTRLPGARAPGDAQGISFWKDCACHAVLRSLHALIADEINTDDGGNEWRLTAVALYEAATDGARAPVSAEISADANAWRVCVDCVVSEFLTHSIVRRALAGADAVQTSIDACKEACGHAYVIGVGVADNKLVPLRPWGAADCRAANALVAALDYEHSADADLFEAVHWRSPEDEVERVARVRSAVDLMREAQTSARHATETAARLVAAAEAARRAPGLSKKDLLHIGSRLSFARTSCGEADVLWREQCRRLCDGLSLLLRAHVHQRRTGWVGALLESGDTSTAARIATFKDVCLSRLACTDDTVAAFPELEEYVCSVHPLCAPAEPLWERLASPAPTR